VYLTVDDNRIYAYTANHAPDATKPSVAFIHGAANDHSVWALQSRYFGYHGWNALAVDLPGHGRSGGRAMADIGALADWTVRLLDAVGIDRAALVGHSMGSLIALETAARHQSRVSAIALIGTAVPMPVSETLLDASRADDSLAYQLINAFAHSAAGHIGGNRVPGLWMTGNNMRLM
jgi:pimeloyl-ACP methyl ester carboxylesterase